MLLEHPGQPDIAAADLPGQGLDTAKQSKVALPKHQETAEDNGDEEPLLYLPLTQATRTTPTRKQVTIVVPASSRIKPAGCCCTIIPGTIAIFALSVCAVWVVSDGGQDVPVDTLGALVHGSR